MIPRTLHRIWLGPAMPEWFQGYWRRWAYLHPGWTLRTWTEEDLTDLVNQVLFDEMPTLAGKADVARYDILASQGGVYVDCDVEPVRNIEPLLDGVGAFCGWEDEDSLTNAVMGSEAAHAAMAVLVAELPAWAERHAADPPNRRTGPALLNHLWQNRTDVSLFAPGVFYPVHWSGRRSGPRSEAFAVHHWAHSWA